MFIVVPVSLLITFRLTGMLPEPEETITIVETTNLEAVKWEFERPAGKVKIWEKVGTTYDDEVSVVFAAFIGSYHQKHPDYGAPSLHMAANGTAVVQNGFIESVRVIVSEEYEPSFVDWKQLWWGPNAVIRNLSVVDYVDWRDVELQGNMKALVDFAGINRPSSISFRAPFGWVLLSPSNQTHQLDLISEVVYFNGTVYKKLVQPFQLRIIGHDDNDSFEKADEITFGSLKAYVGKFDHDPVDYYRIWLEHDQRIQVELFLPSYERRDDPEQEPRWYYAVDLNLWLYDPDRELAARSVRGENATRQIIITSDFTGWWYIRIEHPYAGETIYVLNLALKRVP